ncbi:DeoR/GlpR family DNA-binding transcription regulator [Sporomusa sp.]|jgi:DeoR/GlpR family transcriptional regulator of sugar metabolism|uniref:DeoR/GlpR family DNA-binding transcription regulator n=1 Tax=Sporomusa sp. TaxID=2078658 RepID=UPI00297085FD|nr:DeoR/GlpR family DNA-binding transcription regulator [Sporomusa sp.]MDF2572564.1 srlR [Sporomusa sp.]HWR06210.1 DeoR/GlpR family DNA-binding transcription regulator [Sporomusa sp.]
MLYESIEQRRQKILDELNVKDKVYVKTLAQKFDVSMETIRRDLDYLATNNQLTKIFGGAIKVKNTRLELLYNERAVYNLQSKKIIAAAAANFIEDNDTIALLGGSTLEQMTPHLLTKKNLFVVTNSLPISFGLLNYRKEGAFDGRVIVIGGETNAASMATSGFFAEDMLTQLSVNKAFLSCAGFSPSNISTFMEEHIRLSKLLVEKSDLSILVADSSKLNVHHLYNFATLKDFDMVVCDHGIPDEWINDIDSDQLQWLTAK